MNDKPKPKTQWDEAMVIARNLSSQGRAVRNDLGVGGPTDPDPSFVCECMNAITLERIAESLGDLKEILTQVNWNLDRLVERTS